MTKWAYYNDSDPFVCEWVRNLIAAGMVAPGEVDCRPIQEVDADDLKEFRQVHMFCGIAGWSYALRLAGISDDRPIWTGSCPCQPFSAAGAGKATADERHLWPAWFPLIAECRPPVVYGEQVEAAIGWGWLDLVFSDLEAEGYACGASILPACSVGAPHIRDRVWFVADADGGYSGTEGLQRGGEYRQRPEDGRASDRVVNPSGEQARVPGRAWQPGIAAWSNVEFIPCTDGKARPIESGSFPLAHGVRRRTSKLRAYGNAIVPQVAAAFIQASLEAMNTPSPTGVL